MVFRSKEIMKMIKKLLAIVLIPTIVAMSFTALIIFEGTVEHQYSVALGLSASLLFVLIIAFIFQLFLLKRFRDNVFEPILDLHNVMKRMLDERDFSLRVNDKEQYETIQVMGEFNQILNILTQPGEALMGQDVDVYDQILDSISEGVVIIGSDLIIKNCNKRAELFFSFEKNNILNKKLLEFKNKFSCSDEKLISILEKTGSHKLDKISLVTKELKTSVGNFILMIIKF